MSNKAYVWFSVASSIAILIFAVWFWGLPEQEKPETPAVQQEENPVEMKKARSEYYFRLLRDPATNSIPDNIRSRELEYSRQLPVRGGGMGLRKSAQASQQAEDITWQSAGPNELGGRTRALAIDQRDSDTIIAGGVSGGIWKSTNGGSSWELKTYPNQNMSVTDVTQDPNNLNTWYYTSGEFRGNTAAARGGGAFYHGTGIYKSTNNGDTWSRISSTEDQDTEFNSRFDYLSRIKVSPETGSIFAASNGAGLLRSTDSGMTFPILRGTLGGYSWTDFDIDSKGNIVAVFSTENSGISGDPGIFYSTNDGDNWTDITPADFPAEHDRSVIAFAPSEPDSVYVFTRKVNSGTNQGVSFFKIDVTDPQNPVAEDRSANLPNFGDPVGDVNTQINYNMVVSVKPDDPDFVMIGGTNLFRSRDGFATAPADSDGDGVSDDSEKDEYWIGGYAKFNNISQYSGQHPDQHVIAYDPDDPNRVWAGHDGGLSLTTDITASAVTWQDKDDGYVTGQFYTVDIPADADDNRILGGTQDNGTPFFRTDDQGSQQTALTDISTGDGSYGFFTPNYIFASSQRGNIRRHTTDGSGNITNTIFSIQPPSASNQLFVHPYAVDPSDESVMFYPEGTTMWRNTSADQSSVRNEWNSFTAVTNGNGHFISTLEMTSSPSNILYFAASSSSSAPKIYRLENASSSTSPTELSATGAPNGAYVHDLAVNPHDGDEVIAVMSNYNIVGLYHTTDGGNSWTDIEGNLEGDTSPGPSLRSATILPTSSGKMYLVGTSTGLYSTSSLSGNSTNWARESDGGSAGSIGFSIVEYVTSRPSDGTVAAGTHGRGIFLGDAGEGQTLPVDITYNVGSSWQLVGSPMASSSEVTLGSDLTIFGFSGTYKSSSTIESQKGYWVKSRSGSQINFSGQENISATITLEEGWNIIGGITDTVSTSNISDPNGILSTTPVQEYVSGSYQEATDIKSGQGYWIHANQAGDIELSSSGSSSGKESLADASSSVDRLTFKSGRAEQHFFVAGNEVDNTTRGQFRMPPKAPAPLLDVRTPEGFRIAEDERTQLELTAGSYPVRVSLSSTTFSDYMLKGVTGRDTVYYDLRAGSDAEIQQPHKKYFLETLSGGEQITENDLLPNYPNPFNPATQIRYQVASRANVSIEVYNVLGQKVRTLVNQEQPSGSYSVRFDGSNLSSGTYFIHLKAGNTAKVQKMTLIK